MRGLGQSGHRTQLKDYIILERLDIIFVQETIRQDFTDQELRNLEGGDKFLWSWLPARGHSGGCLLGIRDITLEVGSLDQGKFFLAASILHPSSRFIFDFIGVYGPADHARSPAFLQELEHEVAACRYPVVISGDFDLIRGPRDKNKSNINWL